MRAVSEDLPDGGREIAERTARIPSSPAGTQVVLKYLGSTRRAARHLPQRTDRFADVLARTRFDVPQQSFVPGLPDLLRDSESVLWDWPGDTEVVMARKPG